MARLRLHHTIPGIPRPSWGQRRTFVFGLRWWTWSALSTSLRFGRRSHDALVVALADGRSLGGFGIFVDVGSLCDFGRGANLFIANRTGTGLGRHGGRDLIFFNGHDVKRKRVGRKGEFAIVQDHKVRVVRRMNPAIVQQN